MSRPRSLQEERSKICDDVVPNFFVSLEDSHRKRFLAKIGTSWNNYVRPNGKPLQCSYQTNNTHKIATIKTRHSQQHLLHHLGSM